MLQKVPLLLEQKEKLDLCRRCPHSGPLDAGGLLSTPAKALLTPRYSLTTIVVNRISGDDDEHCISAYR